MAYINYSLFVGGAFMFFRSKILYLAIVILASLNFVFGYTISYELNGGINHPENPTEYEIGDDLLNIFPPTREGYQFLGWYIIQSNANTDINLNSHYKYSNYNSKSKNTIAKGLGHFTLSARWGLIPQIPKQDMRGCYLIYTAEELYGLFKNNYFSDCASLQNDIVVNENLLNENGRINKENYVWWLSPDLRGTFEGNGFKIFGLRGENGLFSEIYSDYSEKSSVRNLGIEDSYFSGNGYVGSIAGTITSSTELINIYSTSTVYAEKEESFELGSGGLVGFIEVSYRLCLLCKPNQDVNPQYAPRQENAPYVKIENAYFSGHIIDEMNHKKTAGIVFKADGVSLTNVYNSSPSNVSDAIIMYHSAICEEDLYLETENVFYVNHSDSNLTKATPLTVEQFRNGTAFNVFSQHEKGSVWSQKIDQEDYPILENYKHSIQYILNGGTNNKDNPVQYSTGDGEIILASPNKEGDVFEGWFLDSNFTKKIDTIPTEHLGDWTIYAKWKSYFTITYVSYKYIDKWSSDSSTYKIRSINRSGYSFEGWYSDSLFTNLVTEIPSDNTEDFILYAKWSMNTYTIKYHLNGGIISQENPETYSLLDIGYEFKEPTLEGAIFLGWYDKSLNGLNISTITYIMDFENLNLYALWAPIPQKPKKGLNGCYLITNKEELYWFAGVVNGTLINQVQDEEACASLQNDIVINDENIIKKDSLLIGDDSNTYFIWDPIVGDGNNEWRLYGNGHSISGIILNKKQNHFHKGYYYKDSISSKYEDYYRQIHELIIYRSYIPENILIDNLLIDYNPFKDALPEKTPLTRLQMNVNGNKIQITGAPVGARVTLLDIQGRVILRTKVNAMGHSMITVPHQGRYLVLVGKELKIVSTYHK